MAQKAKLAQVDFGYAKIEGLMLPNGEYRMGASQAAVLLQFDTNQASRSIKSLLGKGYQFDSVKSELNPKPVNTISLSDFLIILIELTARGNSTAKELMSGLAQESIEKRFNKAFDLKFSDEEFNEKLKIRMERLQARIVYTDVLRDRHIKLYGTKPTSEDYKQWTVLVNKYLYGRSHFRCDRDNMTPSEQRMITDFERTGERFALMFPLMTPMELIKKTLETFPLFSNKIEKKS